MKLPGPDHPITIEPAKGRIVVRFGDTIVADTSAALELREASYPPVLYIPRADTIAERYDRTDRQSHCPYKGDASYYTLTGPDGERAENAVWSYEAPYPAMAAIGRYVAFYPNLVKIERSLAA